MSNIIVLSLPRSGSSVMAQLIASAGYKNYISNNSELITPSQFNKDGYFEDTFITLLNDQLIRFCYWFNYSFLYTPSLEQFRNLSLSNVKGCNWDMLEVYMPPNYKDKVKEYTGCDWDVWGLTRTSKGEKWHKCYSKFGIQYGEEVIDKLNKLVDNINSQDKLIIKDPRLALVAPLYNLKNTKIIYIKRGKEDTLKSMKKHYGKDLFTQNYLPDTEYCSNHFNYKIGYQDYDYYYRTYNNIIEEYIKDKDSLTIDYEHLSNQDTINSINNFIQSEININLLKK